MGVPSSCSRRKSGRWTGCLDGANCMATFCFLSTRAAFSWLPIIENLPLRNLKLSCRVLSGCSFDEDRAHGVESPHTKRASLRRFLITLFHFVPYVLCSQVFEDSGFRQQRQQLRRRLGLQRCQQRRGCENRVSCPMSHSLIAILLRGMRISSVISCLYDARPWDSTKCCIVLLGSWAT